MKIEFNSDSTVNISGIPNLNEDGLKALSKLLYQAGNLAKYVVDQEREQLQQIAMATLNIYGTQGKVPAIKYIREKRGFGLKQAKLYVEAMDNPLASFDELERIAKANEPAPIA